MYAYAEVGDNISCLKTPESVENNVLADFVFPFMILLFSVHEKSKSEVTLFLQKQVVT